MGQPAQIFSPMQWRKNTYVLPPGASSRMYSHLTLVTHSVLIHIHRHLPALFPAMLFLPFLAAAFLSMFFFVSNNKTSRVNKRFQMQEVLSGGHDEPGTVDTVLHERCRYV